MRRTAIILALTLAGCTGPVDEPFEGRIKAACAKQFPHDFFRRSQCVDLGRFSHVRDQRFQALNEAEGQP